MKILPFPLRLVTLLISSGALLAGAAPTHASTAYGSLNNFDCVNDTGSEAHGFEIELDDVHSTDISYTYDYNHYGVPNTTEDNSDPVHPKVFVRYAATANPGSTWSAYTAVPSGPISPTQGHQFTDPTINFGGEHFGVGYYGTPTAVKYNWLIDDGAGHLIHGPPVYVATPTFTYNPPAAGQPAQVKAVVEPPPPPPEVPVLQFGEASWVKEIKTTTHNAQKVELTELVDPDPNRPTKRNWTNGEPAEVEVEWKLLQTEFANANNPKGELAGAPEDLPGGDEMITRRYEFLKYTGPTDIETGEAVADQIGAKLADGWHGKGFRTYAESFDQLGEPVVVTRNMANFVVVGEFVGAQMSGFDVAPALDLVDHLPDGELNVAYADRRVVLPGAIAFTVAYIGSFPPGMQLGWNTGVFTGTPTQAGTYTFVVAATPANGDAVSKTYHVTITADGVVPTYVVDAAASPLDAGSVAGAGNYLRGAAVTLTAVAKPGHKFLSWSDGPVIVSNAPTYRFTAGANRTLVADFAAISCTITTSALAGGTTSGGGVYDAGASVTVTATPASGYKFVNWTTAAGKVVSGLASYTFTAAASRNLVAHFALLKYAIATSAVPRESGTTSGGGTFIWGSNVTVVATPSPGYGFVYWMEGTKVVRRLPQFSFTAAANRTLVAHFAMPKSQLRDLLQQIRALRATVTKQSDATKLDQAIAHFETSLGLTLWAGDGLRLNATTGGAVFVEHKAVVLWLQDIMNDVGSSIARATLHGFVDKLVAGDSSLAQLAFADAAGGDPTKLAQAAADLSAGNAMKTIHKHGAAVDYYGSAWTLAEQAMP